MIVETGEVIKYNSKLCFVLDGTNRYGFTRYKEFFNILTKKVDTSVGIASEKIDNFELMGKYEFNSDYRELAVQVLNKHEGKV